MSGGIGSRLWPLSRQSRPKQFAPLFDGTSLFKDTVKRVVGLEGFRQLLVITGKSQAAIVRRQLDELDISATIILEPTGRESAPAVATAAVFLAQQDPDAVAVMVASDHHIPSVEHFQRDIGRAVAVAEEGRIVTLGIAPRHPSSAYGYIKPQSADADVSPVDRFVEKPDATVARRYLKEGYVWNSGNFIASASTLIKEFQTLAPDVLAPVQAALADATRVPDGLLLGAAFFDASKISMDFAIMEKTDRASVLRSSIDWSDLGAWDSLYDAQSKDRDGNVLVGDVLAVDSNNSQARVAYGKFAVLCDVDGINVVVEDDVVLVSSLSGSQAVKQVVDRLNAAGRAETDLPNLKLNLPQACTHLKSWFETAALPLWGSVGFDHDLDLWRESLTPEGYPSNENMRARVQGRQSTVFARAGAAGWQGPWRYLLKSITHGIAEHYTVKSGPNAGLLRALVDSTGRAIDDTALFYDQTFQLLAEANGARVQTDVLETGTDTRLAEALGTPLSASVSNTFVQEDFGCTGLYREAPSRAGQPGLHLANPVMHLFEVLLVRFDLLSKASLETSTAARAALAEAKTLADFALAHFIDAKRGLVYEICDADWKPLTRGKAGQLEPGHHFEWAWLFARYARLSGEKSYLEAARTLYASALKGYSPQSGAIVQFMDVNGRRTSQTARLWAQTEWLKASLILMTDAPEGEEDHYRNQAEMAVNKLMSYLATDIRGLWHDKLKTDGTFELENSPASSLYHIASAIEALEEAVEWADADKQTTTQRT